MRKPWAYILSPAILIFTITVMPYMYSDYLLSSYNEWETIPFETIKIAGNIVFVCGILNTIAVTVSVYRWAKISKYKKLSVILLCFVTAMVVGGFHLFLLFMISLNTIIF